MPPQMNTVGKHATCIYKQDGYIVVRYHQTEVVKFNSKQAILDHGGWETTTTKARMNQVAAQFNLPYYVWQEDYTWYISITRNSVTKSFLFENPMVLNLYFPSPDKKRKPDDVLRINANLRKDGSQKTR